MDTVEQAHAVAFLDWVIRNRPQARCLSDLSRSEIMRLARDFGACTGHHIAPFDPVHQKWLSPSTWLDCKQSEEAAILWLPKQAENSAPNVRREDFLIPIGELHAVGVKARAKPEVPRHDRLARFIAAPNHAIFLFTSEDILLDAYIRDHWAALDGLSGNICDIHVSLTQLQGFEDAYSQADNIRSIRGVENITPSMLPALHVWSTDADLTFSLENAGENVESLRSALRNIFCSMHSLGGPITNAWVTKMRSWNATNTRGMVSGSTQSISGSTASRDIIQISNFYTSAPDTGDLTMTASPENQSKLPKGQSIEDVVGGGKISQSSRSDDDSQVIRRSRADGAITQTKRKTPVMSFLGGKAASWGILGLVIAILAWIAYQYISTMS